MQIFVGVAHRLLGLCPCGKKIFSIRVSAKSLWCLLVCQGSHTCISWRPVIELQKDEFLFTCYEFIKQIQATQTYMPLDAFQNNFLWYFSIRNEIVVLQYHALYCTPVMLQLRRFNLLKPTGHVMHQQLNIQQLYALPTLYLCVLYLSENKQRLVPLTA